MTWTFLNRHARVPDPLATLRLQVRLGQLAEELRRIEEDHAMYARAHHRIAAQDAYDALLHEACRLAGAPSAPHATERTAAEERLREELELSSRGWTW